MQGSAERKSRLGANVSRPLEESRLVEYSPDAQSPEETGEARNARGSSPPKPAESSGEKIQGREQAYIFPIEPTRSSGTGRLTRLHALVLENAAALKSSSRG
tara:strand:- start:34 stop:339 length:306 start_codon:yes stop_codon:yes gene_type:complete